MTLYYVHHLSSSQVRTRAMQKIRSIVLQAPAAEMNSYVPEIDCVYFFHARFQIWR